MQSTQKLTRVLDDLVALIKEEAARNPSFAERLEAITADIPSHSVKRATKPKPPALAPPEVFAVCQEKGEEEFRFWLRSLDLRTLKAVVKTNGFDPGKISRNWTEPDKFVTLIAEQTIARLRRGSGFLPAKTPSQQSETA